MPGVLRHDTEIGNLFIVGEENFLTALYFEHELGKLNFSLACTEGKSLPLLEEAARQLDQYLAGRRKYFTLPLKPEGTPFLQKVWHYLLSLPYGELTSYREIAFRMGNPRSYRAVALACQKNPLPIFIPCHRVVRSDGKIGGYKGGVEVKSRLIALELKNRT
ncbi:methylated-DNA-[protein]-cysteine S-methyltransferase [Thermosyntropha lipolytica DSM 11003]|uniref:Methylated-DNA--protein-cysteine methyltransferase n=1 Tax=Thermosyntropha lipolytica DSM 11003 TaxID=1123382 RepID=A0A1M5LAI7_9FIRM|nr:methylated-DNA--[protein]-cysteine S-methyltransferase [Thermosyntropha lipolytica]SHG61729.1 methylated-DNA-[protein]-cysteine S-methyltransferase [Thermosyntropha lipolytica DSM 11003]